MLLTIDVGNTHTVLGVFEGASLLAHWRLTTRREQTADEYGILVRNLFATSSLDPARVDAVALASVVPPLTPVLVELARLYLGQEPLVVGPGVNTGMPILYEPPGDVGADRIVNGVAAFAAYGGPVIVVDFGTATTFDVITRRGEYVGGVICPGIGHQRGRPVPARGATAARRRAQPGPGGGPQHGGIHSVGALLRLRARCARGSSPAFAPSLASRQGWWPPEGWRRPSRRRSPRSRPWTPS